MHILVGLFMFSFIYIYIYYLLFLLDDPIEGDSASSDRFVELPAVDPVKDFDALAL